MMHFGKSNQQKVHGIQHQLNAHKYDNGIAARQYTDNTNRKQRDREKYVIVYRQSFLTRMVLIAAIIFVAVLLVEVCTDYLFYEIWFFQKTQILKSLLIMLSKALFMGAAIAFWTRDESKKMDINKIALKPFKINRK